MEGAANLGNQLGTQTPNHGMLQPLVKAGRKAWTDAQPCECPNPGLKAMQQGKMRKQKPGPERVVSPPWSQGCLMRKCAERERERRTDNRQTEINRRAERRDRQTDRQTDGPAETETRLGLAPTLLACTSTQTPLSSPPR